MSKTAALADLLHESELSLGQVSRLFGVSSRELTRWLTVGVVPTHQESRLAHVYATVLPLAENPSARRRELLSGANGMSIFHRLLQELPKNAELSPAAFSGRDLLLTAELVESSQFQTAVQAMVAHEKMHPRAPLDALLLTALEHFDSIVVDFSQES